MDKNLEYSKEFKINVVKLALSQDSSAFQVTKELGIPSWKLHGWVKSYKKTNLKNPGNNSPEIKLARLEKENRLLKMEIEILKKAAAYFAKSQQ